MNTFNGKTVETDVVVIGAGGGLAAAAATATNGVVSEGPAQDGSG